MARQIINAGVEVDLSLPERLPIFSRNELQVFYKGRIYVASRDLCSSGEIKIYTETYGLDEVLYPKEQEQEYFDQNRDQIEGIQENFLEGTITDLTIEPGQRVSLGDTLGDALLQSIESAYGPAQPFRRYDEGQIEPLNEDSLFRHLPCSERALFVDGKHYFLTTIAEHVLFFSTAFEPAFLNSLTRTLDQTTPEGLYRTLTDNANKINHRAFALIRNKVWHSDRSFTLYLDDRYWIPKYIEESESTITNYKKLLEKRIKKDAANTHR